MWLPDRNGDLERDLDLDLDLPKAACSSLISAWASSRCLALSLRSRSNPRISSRSSSSSVRRPASEFCSARICSSAPARYSRSSSLACSISALSCALFLGGILAPHVHSSYTDWQPTTASTVSGVSTGSTVSVGPPNVTLLWASAWIQLVN